MSYHYPLHRHRPIEDGSKIIHFNPPFENLSGDRIHEWIGARSNITPIETYPDFDRILRQQILLKELLNMNISYVYSANNAKGITDEVLELLKSVDYSWNIEKILKNDYEPTTINMKSVLLFAPLSS